MSDWRHYKSKYASALFLVVLLGAVFLNFTDPPWQYIGVVVFLLVLFYPVLLGLLRRRR